MQEERELLPNNVVPSHYNVHIVTPPDFESFHGTEEVIQKKNLIKI